MFFVHPFFTFNLLTGNYGNAWGFMTLQLVLNPFSYSSYFFLSIDGKYYITIKVYCWDNLILLQFSCNFPAVT